MTTRNIKQANAGGFRFDNSYRRLPDAFFSMTANTPVAAPELLLLNEPLAQELGLNISALRKNAANWLAGNALIVGSEPLAQAYAGHQFGNPTMLGDGRALLLGEQLTPSGARVDIQLKGAGRTAFSRGGDGRAALGPMLREYLISEALTAQGIASSRSLAVVASGEPVYRETPLPGAILTRVADSHIRVGTFQYAAWQSDKTLLPALLDYVLQRHYPKLIGTDNAALGLLDAVMERQIELVVGWLRVGFIHGVLNTDNVTISGAAIDFGPCAFMDEFDPATVFSSIDRQGRYAFGNQPAITQWNLERFAETLLPLIDADQQTAIDKATQLLRDFMPRFGAAWRAMMCTKLGLLANAPSSVALVDDWQELLQQQKMDYTNAHRALMRPQLPDAGVYHTPAFTAWHQRWLAAVQRDEAAGRAAMARSNPAVIPRNHQVNLTLDSAQAGDMQPFNRLLEELLDPYRERAPDDPYCQPPAADERILQTFCGT